MGNTSSSSPGTLSIVLDPPTTRDGAYVAGSPLSGSVYVRSAARVDAVICVDAYLSGEERSRVRYTETRHHTDSQGRRRTRRVAHYRRAERRIVHVPIHLGDVSAGIRAGAAYRFPFQVRLPADLPGSMYVGENGANLGGGHAEIAYRVAAELRGGGWFGRHRTEQPIRVGSAPLPAHPVPHLVAPIPKDVKYCCCFHAGTVTMGARVENTRVGRGERVAVDFACKNQSLRGIDRVEVTVEEQARFSAGGKHNRASRVIATATVRETEHWARISKREMKELKAKSRSHTDSEDSLLGRPRSMLQVIHEALYDSEHRTFVSIDPSSLESFQGLLLQVSHFLTIKVVTSGCCTRNPSIEVPMYLGTLATSSSQSGQQSPTLAEPIVAVPSAPPLQPMPMPVPSAPPAEWASAVATPVKVVGESAAVVGGAAIWESEGDADDSASPDAQHGEDVPVTVAEVVPSLHNLLTEIAYAVSPLSAVEKRLDDDEWRRRVFAPLTPSDYAAVITAAGVEFDHPEMAALVAPSVRSYTHEYVVAALRAVADWLRTPLLSKALPLCSDLRENAAKIRAELTDWELVCTERDFEQATGGR